MTPGIVDRCAVCRGAGTAEPRLDGLLRRCGTCTFTWTAHDLPAPAELYRGEYFTGGGYDDYYRPVARRFEAALRLRWLLRSVRPGTLLEAGSAAGYFVATARAAGIDARGIEISAAATEYARRTLGVPVRQGGFEELAPGAAVDAVCAFHVLEHVEDPAEFIRAARDALSPGGWLALEVPNIDSAAAGRLGHAWPQIQPAYHRWHFTPRSLSRLVTAGGFTVRRQDTVFSRFYWSRRGRLRHARDLWVADVAASRQFRVTHPSMGDCLRLVARRGGAR